MKKILFFVLILFISTNVFAECAIRTMFDPSSGEYIPIPCPTTSCPSETFMGDDGKCYTCDAKEDVFVKCIGKEKAFEICPHRNFIDGCSTVSKFCPKSECPKGSFMGDDGKCYDCNEEEEISINCIGKERVLKLCPNRAIHYLGSVLQSYICSEGYEKQGDACCKDDDCIGDIIIDF